MQCHGDSIAAVGRELVAARDARVAPAAPVKRRAQRSDKGQARGPHALKGGSRYRIGLLSLYRYRYGMERQVSQAVREAVAAAEEGGGRPWMEHVQTAETGRGVGQRGGGSCGGRRGRGSE